MFTQLGAVVLACLFPIAGFAEQLSYDVTGDETDDLFEITVGPDGTVDLTITENEEIHQIKGLDEIDPNGTQPSIVLGDYGGVGVTVFHDTHAPRWQQTFIFDGSEGRIVLGWYNITRWSTSDPEDGSSCTLDFGAGTGVVNLAAVEKPFELPPSPDNLDLSAAVTGAGALCP